MKTNYFYLGALLVCLASCSKKEEVKVVEEDVVVKKDSVSSENETPQPMDSVAMMKAWQEYATPTEPHKRMASEVGTWTEDMTFWMSPDDKNPQKNTATVEIKMILGGRYQEQKHKGKVMGMDFEGISVLAYNNASGEYTSTWIDNMATGLMVGTGKFDEATKSTTFLGEMTDPLTKKSKKTRQIITIVDDNTQKIESYDTTPEGKEFKSMEILMKRKK